MNDRYEIAEQNGMSREFADWFFDKKKDGCGDVWFAMMAATAVLCRAAASKPPPPLKPWR